MLLDAVDLQFGYRPHAAGRAVSTSAGAPRPPRGLAVAGVSLHIGAGAIVGILGPNGSGKTTLIKLLSGALKPAAGTVALDDRPMTSYSRASLARRLAVVPQETHLAFDYTVLEIVLMGRYPRLGAFEIEGPSDIASALDALAATGTRDLASRAFPTLSGGEKQRVIIASALAQLDDRIGSRSDTVEERAQQPERPVLFLDEPTASLDLRYQLELASLLKRLNRDRGITMVLSTHDLSLASSVCTHLILLSRGRVLTEGAPADVLTPALIGQLYELEAELVAPILK